MNHPPALVLVSVRRKETRDMLDVEQNWARWQPAASSELASRPHATCDRIEMADDEEQLSEVGVGSSPWGWRGSGELPLAVPGPSGRPGQEPLPIWDSNTDAHFRRTLLQLRVPLVIGPSALLASAVTVS